MRTVTLLALLACFISFSSTLLGQADDPETPYNDQQVAIIKRGYKVLEAYQKVYQEKNGALPKLNLREAVLPGVDFRGMNLDNADFREADLRGARFGDKPAIRTKEYDNEDRLVSGQATVPAASLRNADFRGSDIGEHNLKVADLSLTNSEGANFSETDMTGAKFIKAKLKGASFKETSLIGTNFRRADLTDADLTEADVEGATFDRTILIRTQMAGLNVDECTMTDVFLTEKALQDYLDMNSKKENVFED
jgi:uncharacterized protein YjbI with pentapeptide repeats